MTRVWSMATTPTDSDCAQREIQDAIIYVSPGSGQSSAALPPSLHPPLTLPPDNDSGYVASPSSATRLATFRFDSPNESTIESTLDEELLSIDLFFAPIILLENNYSEVDETDEQYFDDFNEEPMRTESRNSGGSGGSSNSSERMASTPIPIPISNSLVQTSHLTERSGMSSPLSLSHSDMIFATNSHRFVSDYNERGFGGEMFARHHRRRYNIGIDTISPQSPPSSAYWSRHLMGMVSPLAPRSHHNNHYMNSDENMNSAQTSMDLAQNVQLPPPSPMSSMLSGSQGRGRITATSDLSIDSREDSNNNQPLPDVVNVEMRVRGHNSHTQARRAVSVSLPIDAETIRSVGMSLRQISDDFAISSSMILSNPRPGSDGMVGNILTTLRLSRRSLSARFRSHYIQRNGRPRSFSTNDAPEE